MITVTLSLQPGVTRSDQESCYPTELQTQLNKTEYQSSCALYQSASWLPWPLEIISRDLRWRSALVVLHISVTWVGISMRSAQVWVSAVRCTCYGWLTTVDIHYVSLNSQYIYQMLYYLHSMHYIDSRSCTQQQILKFLNFCTLLNLYSDIPRNIDSIALVHTRVQVKWPNM